MRNSDIAIISTLIKEIDTDLDKLGNDIFVFPMEEKHLKIRNNLFDVKKIIEGIKKDLYER